MWQAGLVVGAPEEVTALVSHCAGLDERYIKRLAAEAREAHGAHFGVSVLGLIDSLEGNEASAVYRARTLTQPGAEQGQPDPLYRAARVTQPPHTWQTIRYRVDGSKGGPARTASYDTTRFGTVAEVKAELERLNKRGVTLVALSADEPVVEPLTIDTPCLSTDAAPADASPEAEPLPEEDVRAQLAAELEGPPPPCPPAGDCSTCEHRVACKALAAFDPLTAPPFVRKPKPAVTAH